MHPISLFWLFAAPNKGWQQLVNSRPTLHRIYLLHVLPFSLIPPIMMLLAGHAGMPMFQLVSRPKLALIAIALFLVQMVVVPLMAGVVRHLAEIIDCHPTYRETFLLAAIAPTPLWMAPICLFFPDLFVTLIIVALALMAAAGLIFYGIPAIFKIHDQGKILLIFGAILSAGMIAWGFLMVMTLVVWGAIQNLHLPIGLTFGN